MILIQLDCGFYDYARAKGVRFALLGLGLYALRRFDKKFYFGLVCEWGSGWNKEWRSG